MNNLLDLIQGTIGSEILDFLENDDVIEVMCNPDNKIWVDTLSKGSFFTGITADPISSRGVITLVANSVDTEVNTINPILSAELPGCGSRFQGMLPPCVENPSYTIRKKALLIFTLQDYVDKKIMTHEQKATIVSAVSDKKNILIAGGTSSGKTTLANAVLNEMANFEERILILEDTKELQCSAPNCVFMRTTDHASLKDLLQSVMRFNPDRICVGELRNGAAIELLKAWNSGHPGGFCTIHADSCEKGLKKLGQYISEVSIMPQNDLIADSVDLIINIKKEGLRRFVKEIAEVEDFDVSKNKFTLKVIL